MGSQGEKRRQVLGTAAGAVVGAKKGSDQASKHNVIGALLGAFVGGVGGSFAADLVNAATRVANAQSSLSKPASRSLALLETRGFVRGKAFENSQLLPIMAMFMSAIVEFTAKHPEMASAETMPPETMAELTGAIREYLERNKSEMRERAENAIKQTYDSFGQIFASRGEKLEFNYEQDKRMAIIMLEDAIQRILKGLETKA